MKNEQIEKGKQSVKLSTANIKLEIFPERKFVPLVEQISDFSNSNPIPMKTDFSPIQKSKESLRIEMMQRQYEKRTSDKWRKALRELKINENLLSDKQELLG